MGKGGKHNPDNVLLGIHASPETKALAGLVASLRGETITDALLEGLHILAECVGVEKDGKVVPRWRDEIAARAQAVRSAKKSRQK